MAKKKRNLKLDSTNVDKKTFEDSYIVAHKDKADIDTVKKDIKTA